LQAGTQVGERGDDVRRFECSVALPGGHLLEDSCLDESRDVLVHVDEAPADEVHRAAHRDNRGAGEEPEEQVG